MTNPVHEMNETFFWLVFLPLAVLTAVAFAFLVAVIWVALLEAWDKLELWNRRRRHRKNQ